MTGLKQEFGSDSKSTTGFASEIDSSGFSDVCASNEQLTFDAVIKLFDVDRRRTILERFFTPARLARTLRLRGGASTEQQSQKADISGGLQTNTNSASEESHMFAKTPKELSGISIQTDIQEEAGAGGLLREQELEPQIEADPSSPWEPSWAPASSKWSLAPRMGDNDPELPDIVQQKVAEIERRLERLEIKEMEQQISGWEECPCVIRAMPPQMRSTQGLMEEGYLWTKSPERFSAKTNRVECKSPNSSKSMHARSNSTLCR